MRVSGYFYVKVSKVIVLCINFDSANKA